jgi:hypothetical protein
MPFNLLRRSESRLLTWTSWVLARVQQYTVEWRLVVLRRKKRLGSYSSTPEARSSGRKNQTSQSASVPLSRREPPPLSLGHLRHSPLPRSLNELSQPQLELALSVVHNQMHKPLHNSPFLVVWEPPQELSHLPQSEWLCLIEVWEQLLNQRRRNPLQ